MPLYSKSRAGTKQNQVLKKRRKTIKKRKKKTIKKPNLLTRKKKILDHFFDIK